jgi:deazaflavin-dependent oxidoreductase (nitroreductase family)
MTDDGAGARRPPAQLPADMKAFNQKLIEEFRATGGRLSGPMAGRQLLLLTTTGARSGERRTTVIGYRPDGDRYVVIASDNGAPAHPAWYLNLLKDPSATVEVGPEKLEVRARTAGPDERTRLAPLVEYLERQQQRTDREIPIVVLEPS